MPSNSLSSGKFVAAFAAGALFFSVLAAFWGARKRRDCALVLYGFTLYLTFPLFTSTASLGSSRAPLSAVVFVSAMAGFPL